MAKVIQGKEGYLFLAGDNNRVLEQHTGKRMLDKSGLSRWNKLINARLQRLKAWRCKFYMQIVPDKHSVYSDYLPDEFKYNGKKNIDLVTKIILPILKNNLNIPLDELKHASLNYQTYHKTDTHWTDRGAYIGYCQLIQTIKQDFQETPILNNPNFILKPYRGDLGIMEKLMKTEDTEFLIDSQITNPLFDNKVSVTGQIKVFKNNEINNELVVVVFGGSSTTNFINYITQSFKTVIFCWSATFDYLLLNNYQPDLIIFQVRERYLIRPADDELGLTTTEIAFAKSFLPGRETLFTPVQCDIRELLLDCLSKIGYRCNNAYLTPFKNTCAAIGINNLYSFALEIDREKIKYKNVKSLIQNKIEEIALNIGKK